MPKQALDLCLNCSVIRGKILVLNKWFDSNRFLVKCLEYQQSQQKWIGFNLNYIRQLANDIVDALNKTETAVTLIEKSNSAYIKLIKSEISFLTQEWHESIESKLSKITRAERILIKSDDVGGAYDLNALTKLEISMIDNEKLIKHIEEHVREPRDVVFNIEDHTRNALMNVRCGRRRIARAKVLQYSTNQFQICLTFSGLSVILVIVIIVVLIVVLFK